MKRLSLLFCLVVVGVTFTEARAAAGSLRGVILAQQRQHVRLSYGQADGQCFTWDDLSGFKQRDVPGRVVRQLRASAQFRALVAQLRKQPAGKRARYLQKCRAIAHPTWAQLGRITPSGQTEAGRTVELLIAQAVVRLANEMLASGGRG